MVLAQAGGGWCSMAECGGGLAGYWSPDSPCWRWMEMEDASRASPVSSPARSTQPRRAHLPPCTPLPDTTSANNRGEAWLLLATTMGWGRRLLQHLEIYIEIRFKHVQICSYKLCPMWAWCDIYLFSTSISFLGSGNSFLVSQLFTELLISIRSPFRIPSDLCQFVMLMCPLVFLRDEISNSYISSSVCLSITHKSAYLRRIVKYLPHCFV